MSAATFRSRAVVKLDRPAQPDVQLTEEDAQNPKKISVVVTKLLRDVAGLLRRFAPQERTFEDIAVAGSTGSPVSVRLPHGLNGRVRWWIADWSSTSTVAPVFRTNTTNTTKNVLVLSCCTTGTVSIMVRGAG